MGDGASRLEVARDLSRANTMALPCVAARFWQARDQQEVIQGLRLANEHAWPLTVLGGGSNLLLPAQLGGLTLSATIGGLAFQSASDGRVEVIVGAAVPWHDLVAASVERDLWGLENLALIPGWTGGAPIQNIGAYGVELADVLVWVELVDRQDGKLKRLDRDACELGYRDSIFKGRLSDRVVITRVCLSLSRHPAPQLDYGVLGERVPHSPTARNVFDAVCAIRREKLPDPVYRPNAGSFFKNPVVSASLAARLAADTPGMPSYPQPDGRIKLAAGWLIDQCGLKGFRAGAFGIHDNQALVIVHFGNGSLAELLAFADGIVERVESRFGVTLEREPRQAQAFV